MSLTTSPPILDSKTRLETARLRWSQLARRPDVIFGVALVLRLLVIIVGHTYRINPRDNLFGFGWETGRIAKSIAEGHGFSSPFHDNTGPTAWVAPLYPYLVAGVFKLFGIYTQSSAFALLAMNSIFSALTCVTIYRIGQQTVGERAAFASAWTWALLPYSMYWAVRWIWETSLTALLLSVVILLALSLERSARKRDWALFGATWGLIAVTNPSCLSVLPFVLGWICWRQWRNSEAFAAGAAVAVLITIAMMVPWTIRNYIAFHHLIPMRSNFGVELRLGNSPTAQGLWMWWLHPSQDDHEFAKYQAMGEIAYAKQRQAEAITYIRSHPSRFLGLCFRRFVSFWNNVPKIISTFPRLSFLRNLLFLAASVLAWMGLGLIIQRRRRGAFLFAVLMIVYPAIYYITFPHPRYRHPIEPEMMIMGVYLISAAEPRCRADDSAR
jgi:4-amino-4-deoxy-L-arabinose transferase-like glycosyltransferase